jgi:hypothetical protein
MARFLVAATDLESGYKAGEIVTAQPDSHVWTVNEGLPLFWQIDVPQVSLSIAVGLVGNLMDPAMPGDPELGAPDPEDRFIRRARGHVRVFPDALPNNKANELARDGQVTLTLGQAMSAYRRVYWNRAAGEVQDTGVGALG